MKQNVGKSRNMLSHPSNPNRKATQYTLHSYMLCLKKLSKLEQIYQFKNEVGIDKKYWNNINDGNITA